MNQPRPGLVRRALDFLTAGDDPIPEVDPDPVPSGPFPIAQARGRRLVDCRGEIRSTGVLSFGSGSWFTAEVVDDTGRLMVVWMGRVDLPGVRPGRRIRVKGRLTVGRGRRMVFNPDYALEPGSGADEESEPS